MPCRTAGANGQRNRDHAECDTADHQRRHGQAAPQAARDVGSVHHAYARPQHPHRRGPDRPAVQLEREAAGTDAAAAGPLREARCAGEGGAADLAGDARRDDRHDAIAGQLLHEEIPAPRLHRLQARPQGQQLTPDHRPARLGCPANSTGLPNNRAPADRRSTIYRTHLALEWHTPRAITPQRTAALNVAHPRVGATAPTAAAIGGAVRLSTLPDRHPRQHRGMSRNVRRARMVATWYMSMMTIGALSIALGAPMTIATSELLLAACVVPPLVLLRVWSAMPIALPVTS